jgi:hypothetical protein
MQYALTCLGNQILLEAKRVMKQESVGSLAYCMGSEQYQHVRREEPNSDVQTLDCHGIISRKKSQKY